MLFHLTPEGHIETGNEQRRTETDGGRGSFTSEQELQEVAGEWPDEAAGRDLERFAGSRTGDSVHGSQDRDGADLAGASAAVRKRW